MKKELLKKITTSFVFSASIIAVVFLTSCNEKNNATESPELDCCLGIFTFEEYHLNGKWWEVWKDYLPPYWEAYWWENCFECSCNWVGISQEAQLDIIDSQEELKKHIECEWEQIIPTEIDFSKHTLLLFRGETRNGISNVKYELLHTSRHKLKFVVNIKLGDTFGGGNWTIPILTNKLCDKNIIETIVTEVK